MNIHEGKGKDTCSTCTKGQSQSNEEEPGGSVV